MKKILYLLCVSCMVLVGCDKPTVPTKNVYIEVYHNNEKDYLYSLDGSMYLQEGNSKSLNLGKDIGKFKEVNRGVSKGNNFTLNDDSKPTVEMGFKSVCEGRYDTDIDSLATYRDYLLKEGWLEESYVFDAESSDIVYVKGNDTIRVVYQNGTALIFKNTEKKLDYLDSYITERCK